MSKNNIYFFPNVKADKHVLMSEIKSTNVVLVACDPTDIRPSSGGTLDSGLSK